MSGLQDMGRVLIMTKHRIQLKMNFTFIESVWEFLSLRFWEKQGENPSQDWSSTKDDDGSLLVLSTLEVIDQRN